MKRIADAPRRTVAAASCYTGRVNHPPFPIFSEDALHALPKWSKAHDVDRMLHSPQSEDWVTWNLLNLLAAECGEGWWSHVAAVAKRLNPALEIPSGSAELVFWRRVPPPAQYEAASRARMQCSADPAVLARCADPRPVEGESEIDITIHGASFLIYIEAKLGSDISMRTTYDARRNQIARNIDCLLESAAGREPLFWMFVRDAAPGRAYVQLANEYREHPETLARDLPHRDPGVLGRIARGLTLVPWRELGAPLWEARPEGGPLVRAIKAELRRRVC